MSLNVIDALCQKCLVSLHYVKDLSVSKNRIDVIECNAFHGLNGINFLDISKNKFINLKRCYWHGLRDIKYLDISFKDTRGQPTGKPAPLGMMTFDF